MGTVVAQASMSLDGYIAKADNSIGLLFDWYEAGDVEVPTATSGLTFHLTAASADYWRSWTTDLGVIVCGRTLFDFTDGWGGRHTMDTPVVVAKRLCDRADGGQILASELLRALVGSRGGFGFRSCGPIGLKGLSEPLPACEVTWEPAA